MTEQDFSNVIIMDCIPVVPEEKFDKLHGVITKVVSAVGSVPLTIKLCQDGKKNTTGFCFVEYETAADAERAIAKLHNQRLDKNHVFKVCLFTDWEKVKKTPEEYEELKPKEIQADENLQSWLLDPHSREQYMIRYSDETEIWWNDPLSLSRQTLEHKDKWTDVHARWSPLGSYIVTFHQQGVQLRGGPEWKLKGRLAHSGVQLIDFSPKEKYLVTWYNNLIVWEVKTLKKIRVFPGGPTPEHGWPVFKWSHDERFLAKISEDNIHIYEAATMKLMKPDPNKNTSLYIPGVRDFDWSPTENIISYWIPESGDKPARVVLVKINTKGSEEEGNTTIIPEQVTQKNLFRVVDIRMHWQSVGDFLCVKVDRFSKGSKSRDKVTSFELFRMKAKEIAVEVVELTEEVVAFAWEPKGSRFAVIHGNNPSQYNVSFYTMGTPKTHQVRCLKTLTKKQANYLFWSPKGTHIVLAGLSKSFNGILEFWNVQEMELTGGGEYFMCTDVEWDPSGRYVATSVSHYRHQMENGYIVWNFQGRQLLSMSREKFWQFSWRPRPPSALTENRIKKILQSLKDRVQKYIDQEKEMERLEIEAINKQKREIRDEFTKFLKDRKDELREWTKTRRQQRKNCSWDSEDEKCYKTSDELVEEILSIEEEEVA